LVPIDSVDKRPPPVLGVARSVTGKRWVARPAPERLALALSQRFYLPEVVGRVMAGRGIGLDEAAGFLDSRLRDALPDPSHLKDMDVAIGRLMSAIVQDEQIAVLGDYDVDGATSTALFTRYMQAVGARCQTYIPDRLTEGYGPNAVALLGLLAEGVSLVVTVDCGTTSHEPLEAAARAELDVIVIDHHVAEPKLPPAVAVINPNRLDDDSPYGQMAAVGVLFLTLVGLNRALRAAGWFSTRVEPNLLGWLDLVALGTVCDVVPLTGINRAFVSQGLKVLAQRNNAGLRALADVAGVNEAPGCYHLGFIFGPRVNAGGRVGASDLGSRLLSSDDNDEVQDFARRLDVLNRERQAIEAGVLESALRQIEDRGPSNMAVVMAAGSGWHVGVLGIVASRLRERFNRPALVAGIDGATVTGSGRSIPGVDLGTAIIAARQLGLLTKGGGHPMAAGFSAQSGQWDAFSEFLEERIGSQVTAATLESSLNLDGTLAVAAVSVSLAQSISRVGPFGAGNPEPRFAVGNALISRAEPVGDGHVRFFVSGRDGGRLKAIAFRAMASGLGVQLLEHGGAPVHLAGKVRIDTWGGREQSQLIIDDAAPAW
jgi:single-stranded-DNA-specific exonuclease